MPAEVPAPEAVPADAAAAESKAAAALLDAPPAAEAAGSRSAETVIPGKEPSGYQPTEVSIPVARITPSAPAQPAVAPAKPDGAKPAPPKPARRSPPPSRRAGRPRRSPPRAPRPRPAPVRPARRHPAADQRPAYGPSGAGQGYPPPRGGTTPFPARRRLFPRRAPVVRPAGRAVRGPVAALPRPRQAVHAGHGRRPRGTRPGAGHGGSSGSWWPSSSPPRSASARPWR